MSTPSLKSLSTSSQALREWLTSGWIFELAPAGEGFLIGGGTLSQLSFAAFEMETSAVWAPRFFPERDGGIGHLPTATAWTLKIGREELLSWLSTAGENFGKIEKAQRVSDIPSSKISWSPPRKEGFKRAFDRIQTAFRQEGVKKAVPAVFSEGVTACADRLDWISNRIRAGLIGTSKNDLRLYGAWSEAGGFVGATPESLFTRDGVMVSSMAVAGTRALSQLGSKSGDSDAISKLSHEFLHDKKERNEHELVVDDISSVLTSNVGAVEKSETNVQRFGALFHLVTHLVARGDSVPGARDLVDALHPTPALGVSPRQPGLPLLHELHELCGDGVEREGFGAPFVVKHGERVDAIVAIRQLRWTFEDGDRVNVVVGSGCGIVPASDVDREWSELAAKRRAVMKLFRVSTEVNEPVLWSLEILERLLTFGVRRFIVCAGARNAPLVVAAEALRKAGSGLISVESFFEERSAAFYALGIARASMRPVAVLTTSGTAVAELVPAFVEADFSGVPLIAVTADRPRRLRHSGAPQSIPQDELLLRFSERSWDLEEGDEFSGLDSLSRMRPIHVNACLEEPLLSDAQRFPERLAARAEEIVKSLTGVKSKLTPDAPLTASTDDAMSFAALNAILEKRRTAAKGGAVAIVGGLAASEREAVLAFLIAHAIPCLVEGPSGLRGDPRLRHLELRGGDRDLQRWCITGELPFVLRLGGVPTTRVWRDLDESTVITQTLSISRLRFSGLGRGQFIHLPSSGQFAEFLASATPKKSESKLTEMEKRWLKQDRDSCEKLELALKSCPQSEPALVRALSRFISRDDLMYVGNSLPIRWWDMVATRETSIAVEANRGVNGIDGQLSTAFGLASARVAGDVAGRADACEAWILIGDLTALYDLAAPWAIAKSLGVGGPDGSAPKIRIVVLNNSGGRIFSRVLAKAPGGAAPFENEHSLQFKNWAAMWKLEYARVTNVAELDAAAETHSHSAGVVIEMVPDASETERFWTEL